jgi:hypothetical protein
MRRTATTAVFSAVFFALACDNPQPLFPDSGPPLDAFRNGCPVLSRPTAMPGDDIGGDTYVTYASGFFEEYCTNCHSVTLEGSEARNGAPAGYNWDDEASVRARLPRIRNALGVFNFMPPEGRLPHCDERRRMLRWIDVGAP